MSVGLRPCILQGWAVCDGNCGNCRTTATTTTDGFWYHGSGKLGGEFHPNKPDDKERYGEYDPIEIAKQYAPKFDKPVVDMVAVVRCKDCKQFRPSTMYKNRGVCLLANDEGYGICRVVRGDNFCSWGERKEVEE